MAQTAMTPPPSAKRGSTTSPPGSAEVRVDDASAYSDRVGRFADLKRRYDFYRTLRMTPANQRVSRRAAYAPLIGRIPTRVPGLASIDQLVRKRIFVRDLQYLHDVLSLTPASNCYWVWAGLLLGWAREGRVLRHDLHDADFAYAEEDEPQMLQGLDALVDAGFQRGFSFRNNAGVLTEHTLVRHGAKFEFFRIASVASEWEYQMYGSQQHVHLELTARLPRQDLVPFDFLDRTWLKPVDHASELAALYGAWKTPDPSWDYLNTGGVIKREVWKGG